MSKVPPIRVTRPSLPPLEEILPHLQDIWQRGVLTNNGPLHQQLEMALAEYLGVPYVSLFNNGTIALITALQALDLNGEVITTPYSFVATSHAILWNGLIPVFADIDPATFNLDPACIEAAITERTCAIMPVHCYGIPCDTRAIADIARRHDLRVIYDAAHAFAAEDDGGSLLRHGDLAVLSLHATKVFNTFEGGVIISHDQTMKRRIDALRNFGLTEEGQCIDIGMNGKMSEFGAAVGLAQLNHVDDYIARRAAVSRFYRQELAGLAGVALPPEPIGGRHNHSYYPVIVNLPVAQARDRIFALMNQSGVITRKYFHPLISDMKPYRAFAGSAPSLPHARHAADNIICLPMYPDMSDADAANVVAALKNAVASLSPMCRG